MLRILLISSADSPHRVRDSAMDRFFADVTLDGLREASTDYHLKDYCNWKGIRCTGEKIDQISDIEYIAYDHGNFNIYFLPHTVTNLRITFSHQKFEIHTRMLPRNLDHLALNNNLIYGQPDLSMLPQTVTVVHLEDNCMSGKVHLTRLPPNLERLELYKNLFSQRIVWYDNLPPNIRKIRFHTSADKQVGNKVREVRAVNPERKTDNRWIFQEHIRLEGAVKLRIT